MNTVRFALMLLAGTGLVLGSAGCGHNHADEDDDASQRTYDQVGEVRVYDERAKTPPIRSQSEIQVRRQAVTVRQIQRYDQVGEADLQD